MNDEGMIEARNLKVAYYASALLAAMTIVTFGFAITAIPSSGAFCVEGCFEYPYLDTLREFPGDYLWMPLAMVQVLTYLGYATAVHHVAAARDKVLTHIGLTFATLSALVLCVDYFIQFFVVPANLLQGQTEGIALLTQYNPHGVFIALEELGYLLMVLSLVFIASAFSGPGRMQAVLRWAYRASALVTLGFFVLMLSMFGFDRMDRFEVAAISIAWLALLIGATLSFLVFREAIKSSAGKR